MEGDAVNTQMHAPQAWLDEVRRVEMTRGKGRTLAFSRTHARGLETRQSLSGSDEEVSYLMALI